MNDIRTTVEAAMAVNLVDSYKKKDTNKQGQADPSKVLTYTPWAKAVEEALRIDPGFNFGVIKPKIVIYNNDGHAVGAVDSNNNYFTDGNTCWVETWVEMCGKRVSMTLPVMDGTNKAILAKERDVVEFDKYSKTEKTVHKKGVDSMDVNKAIMRCLVKNLAVGFGLGLSIYYGEEMSEEQIEDAVDAYIEEVNACNSREELMAVYNNPEYASFKGKPKAMSALKKRTDDIDKLNKKEKK